MNYRNIFIFKLLLIQFFVFGQNNDKMNLGLDYSFSLFSKQLTSFQEHYIFDGDGNETEWNEDRISEFNEDKFITQFHSPSLSFFSGLSGNSESKFRIGFKVFGGIHLTNQKIKNEEKVLYSANNENLNYHYGAELQMNYTLSNKWSLFLSPNLLIQEGNLNTVAVLREDVIYADPLYFDQTFNNTYKSYALSTYIAGMYSFQKVKLALGPELIWLDYKAENYESIYDRDNDYYIIDDEKITATSKSILQAKARASYMLSSKIGVFASLSLGSNLITKTGVYINL